jgi:flagellar biosynthesis protein FlhG
MYGSLAERTVKEASHLHEVMQASRQRAKIIAVTSGKGGVGKTNIAANLAICLAASQKKVVLLDADLSLGNLDVIMNLNSKYNISHFIDGRKTVEEICHIGPEGLEIICGASGLEKLANINEFQRQRLLNELSRLQENSDLIVIDNAAGISRTVAGFCLAADHVLVVATPEAASMTDAYAMIKVLVGNKYSGQMSLVVNMAMTIAEGKKIYRQISNVVKRFLNKEIYDAGVLLKDEQLSLAVKQRKPVVVAYPKAKISSCIAALAAKLDKCSAAEANNEGFFRKVVDWFF